MSRIVIKTNNWHLHDVVLTRYQWEKTQFKVIKKVTLVILVHSSNLTIGFIIPFTIVTNSPGI